MISQTSSLEVLVAVLEYLGLKWEMSNTLVSVGRHTVRRQGGTINDLVVALARAYSLALEDV